MKDPHGRRDFPSPACCKRSPTRCVFVDGDFALISACETWTCFKRVKRHARLSGRIFSGRFYALPLFSPYEEELAPFKNITL